MKVTQIHPLVRLSVLVATILLSLWALMVHVPEDEIPGWPDSYHGFLTALTYADSEWSQHDFGQEPTVQDKALLEQFRPRLYVGPKGLLPVDFYEGYLPHTRVKKADKTIVKQTDRDTLKKIERQHGYYLDYQGPHLTSERLELGQYLGSLYGQVFREQMLFPAKTANALPNTKSSASIRDYIILKYNGVFPASGLPEDLTWHQALGAYLAGDKDNWHELDIHGAIQIFINKKSHKAEILMLAQHNHFRSYVIGRDMEWPIDNRLAICFAQRSNEPYPCPLDATPHYHRTVGSPGDFSYVLTGEGAWFAGSRDKVVGPNAGAIEVEYQLQFLSHKDPLYVSWIPLGDKQKLFGLFNSFYRTGPPGMNINTHPQLKKYTDLAKFWYFQEGDMRAAKLFERDIKGFDSFNGQAILKYHGQKLFKALSDTHD